MGTPNAVFDTPHPMLHRLADTVFHREWDQVQLESLRLAFVEFAEQWPGDMQKCVMGDYGLFMDNLRKAVAVLVRSIPEGYPTPPVYLRQGVLPRPVGSRPQHMKAVEGLTEAGQENTDERF